jgi:hypothetical protein
MSCVLVLLMAIGVAVVLVGLVLTSSLCPLGVHLPLLLFPGGDEVTRKVTESVAT